MALTQKNQEIIYCKPQERFRLYTIMALTMYQLTV